jgi:uncharacterized protein (DUF924 family)
MSSRTEKIYVSLTAISGRLGALGKVLDSILDQSLPPDKVFLVVSEEGRFLDAGITSGSIPEDVAGLVEMGRVTLIFEPNTGPYRKLVPVLERCAGMDCLIVTADDDTIYPREWLLHLVEAYRMHRCVVAYRGRAMRVAGRQFDRYRSWSKVPTWRDDFGDVDPKYHGLFTLATGVFGVVYHPRFFPDLALLRRLMEIAPLQDDLAFKAAALIKEVPTHIIDEVDGKDPAWSFEEIDAGAQLFDANVDRNDLVWKAIFDMISNEYGFEIGKYLSVTQARSPALDPDWAGRVLSYWFDELSAADRAARQPRTDAAIRAHFGDLLVSLRDAFSSIPADDADMVLAAIIVFDQFPRRVFRHDARKFATDALALELARNAVSRGLDTEVEPARRLYLYMPLMHSENIDDQDRSVALMAALGAEAWTAAVRNRDIIARFGRFPVRNRALGRSDTAEETAEFFAGRNGT